MVLRKRYTIRKAGHFRTICLFFICFSFIFSIYSTIAKYENDYAGYTNIDIANWEIKINDMKLTGNTSELANSIHLVPTTNINEDKPDKLNPGQSGYFDIAINPAGTEVSFKYSLSIDTEKSGLPQNFVIDSYSINGGTKTDLPSSKIVNDNIYLNGKDIFTAVDTQTIRYYWTWNEGDDDESSSRYLIYLKVDLMQIV